MEDRTFLLADQHHPSTNPKRGGKVSSPRCEAQRVSHCLKICHFSKAPPVNKKGFGCDVGVTRRSHAAFISTANGNLDFHLRKSFLDVSDFLSVSLVRRIFPLLACSPSSERGRELLGNAKQAERSESLARVDSLHDSLNCNGG